MTKNIDCNPQRGAKVKGLTVKVLNHKLIYGDYLFIHNSKRKRLFSVWPRSRIRAATTVDDSTPPSNMKRLATTSLTFSSCAYPTLSISLTFIFSTGLEDCSVSLNLQWGSASESPPSVLMLLLPFFPVTSFVFPYSFRLFLFCNLYCCIFLCEHRRVSHC